ncbi:MAG: hypothetical protein IH946_10050, partial [Bacteroidetes bacterium]|nr:hypothetical protein [Bacteroidota bacterium]
MIEVSLKLLGQSGCRIEYDGTVIYMDPYLSNSAQELDAPDLERLIPVPVQPESVTDADWVTGKVITPATGTAAIDIWEAGDGISGSTSGTINIGQAGVLITLDGNTVISGTLNLDSNQINNVANGTSAQDVVTLSQLQQVNSSGNLTGAGVANRAAFWTGSDTLSYD